MENITGVHIYYYMVCRRKLWYFINELKMEDDNENVSLGKLIDENSYSREEKHINIADTINIDFIKNNTLYETKKSKQIEEASVMQLKYYLYYLKRSGADNFSGEINYPALKQKVSVELTADDEKEIENICAEIRKIAVLPRPPAPDKKRICKKCAYYDLCMI